MNIDGVKNGIVLDHIKAGESMKIYTLLGLEKLDCPVAIIQNVEYLLSNVEASTMLSNSEFIVMLNQAHNDRQQLAELLNISEEQLSYIKDSDAGCGLIRYGSSLVPFINRFPSVYICFNC